MSWLAIGFWFFVVLLGGLLMAFNFSFKPWYLSKLQWERKALKASRERRPSLVDPYLDAWASSLRSRRFEVTLVMIMDALFVIAAGLLAYAFLA